MIKNTIDISINLTGKIFCFMRATGYIFTSELLFHTTKIKVLFLNQQGGDFLYEIFHHLKNVYFFTFIVILHKIT